MSESFAVGTAATACPDCGAALGPEQNFCGSCGADLRSMLQGGVHVADPLVGQVIADRYRLVEQVGRGGMGVVYRAEHVRLGKIIAVKLLHGELSRDRELVKRFKREAEAVSRLSHPNTVSVFDFGRADGLMFIAMEFIDGEDLGRIIRAAGRISFARVARICAQVCASLAEAHGAGIIHRDLKPENVLVSQSHGVPDFVKVLDFGLAKLRDTEEAAAITGQGSLVGTPYYMAPEQIRGERYDHRIDIYALGAVMYKALSGVPPYTAETPVGVLTKHLTDRLVPVSDRTPDVPDEADAIVSRALQKDPAKRFQSVDEMRKELNACLDAIGEGMGSSGSREREAAAARKRAGAAPLPVATRDEVERYERGLRRRGRLYGLSLVVLVAGAIGAAVWAVRAVPRPLATSESEPNDNPSHANVLPLGQWVSGHLGRRLSETEGDRDFYLVDNPGGRPRRLRVELRGVPNMDTLVEVVRAGVSMPVLKADTGGVGVAEVVPNFRLVGTRYFVGIRERWESGRFPTENVSDAYQLRVSLIDPGPDDEEELNDTLEVATPIAVGGRRVGFVGWGGDVDIYCLRDEDAGEGTVAAELSGIAGLDLRLRWVDRSEQTSRIVDEARAGGVERTQALPRGPAGRTTCFEVSVPPEAATAARADPERTYTLTVRDAAQRASP
ncbi:MAG: protein kinase [Deltaproteobacteria bacterium]|nr:protein kinase [Deltaproteobacteria bacterium]